MRRHFPTTTILMAGVLGACALACAEAPAAAAQQVQLSPELQEMLRAEMRQIAAATQALPLALATADWRTIERIGAEIRGSYVLEKQLSPSQRKAFEQGLPDQFKVIDQDLHQRADRLRAAAAAHDAELVAFHFYRLLETCTTCHATYAGARFPAFSPGTAGEHDHQAIRRGDP
jgi:hypothetical protein